MIDWMKLVEQTLSDLGGRSVHVPGAKLHTAVSKTALIQGEDFGRYLMGEDKSFGEFLEGMSELTVHKRRGTDMLVGFSGATLPALERESRGRPRDNLRLRQDVYAASTRISSEPYVYIRNRDEFTAEQGDATDFVKLPPVTLDELLDQRRTFSKSLEDEHASERLIRAIEFSANPLAHFHRELVQLGLLRQWHKLIYDRVTAWAGANDVEISQDWFAPRPETQPIDTPQQILSELARHLTDDEVRGLLIPFRAVEEIYKAIPRGREP